MAVRDGRGILHDEGQAQLMRRCRTPSHLQTAVGASRLKTTGFARNLERYTEVLFKKGRSEDGYRALQGGMVAGSQGSRVR